MEKAGLVIGCSTRRTDWDWVQNFSLVVGKGKCKVIRLEAWCGPEGG